MDKKELFNQFIAFTASVHRVTNELTKNVKPNSISQVQYKILEFIKVNQPVTPSEINDCLNMTISNTSRELSKLNEKNLIERVHDEMDKRKQQIYLSKDGEILMDEIFGTIETRFLERIQAASNEDMNEMKEVLDLLQKKLFHP